MLSRSRGIKISSALAYKTKLRHQCVTCIEQHFTSFRLLVSLYRAIAGTVSDVNLAFAKEFEGASGTKHQVSLPWPKLVQKNEDLTQVHLLL